MGSEEHGSLRRVRIVQQWGSVSGGRPYAIWQGENAWLSASAATFLVGLVSIPVLAWLDTAPQVPSAGRAWPLLWMTGLSQAALLETLLSGRAIDERRIRPWVRALRLLVMAIPLYGIPVVPAWQWVAQRQPRWIFRPAAPPPSKRALSTILMNRFAPLARRALASKWGPVGLYLVPMIVLWEAVPTLSAPAGRPALGRILSGLLHVTAASCIAIHLVSQARRAGVSRWRTLLGTAPALFWLPPIPWLPFAGLLAYFWIGPRALETLIGSAYAGRAAASSAWRDGRDGATSEWERAPLLRRLLGPPAALVPPVAPAGELDSRWTSFYRGRALTLPLEAGWLAWGARRLAIRAGLGSSVGGVLDSLAAVVLLVGGLALLAMAVFFVRRLVGRRGGPELEIRLLTFTLLGFGLGLFLGRAIAGREVALLTGVTIIAALLSISIVVTPILLNLLRVIPETRQEDPREQYLWMVLGPLLLLVALSFNEGGDLTRQWRLVETLLIVAPLLGVLPGLRHLEWLVRPNSPREVLAGGLPLRSRLRLLFLVGSGLLPLGGLALPLWAALQRRGAGSFLQASSRDDCTT